MHHGHRDIGDCQPQAVSEYRADVTVANAKLYRSG